MGKVIRPAPRGVLPRKRLFGLLDGIREKPVIWVSGPGGCGKTTLVSSYIECRKLFGLWYQVDEGDSDPATFFYYLGQAAQKGSPRKKISLPFFTQEFSRGLPAFTQWYFEKLFAVLRIPSMLVFDNFQEMPEGGVLPEIILRSLTRLPAGCNILIISRSDPPPAFIRLRANHQIGMIGWDELRFTLSETGGIIRLKGSTLEFGSQAMIQRLHETSDGWAAGLVLILERMKKEKFDSRGLEKLSREEIFDYFASEIFTKTREEIQEFLLKTALFPKMTVEMAEKLTGLSSSGQILSRLNRDNYFTEKRLEREPVYQFHPLFREFLCNRAENLLSEEARFGLKQRAAILLEKDGQIEGAIALLQEIQAWDQMVRLISKEAPSLVAQGRRGALKQWLESIPSRVLEEEPWLLYWMGVASFLPSPQESRPYLEKALAKFKTQNHAAGSFLAVSWVVLSIMMEANNFKSVDPFFPLVKELLQRFREFPSEEIELQFPRAVFYAMIFRRPDDPEIENWADRLHFLADRSSNLDSQLGALATLLFYCNHTGNLERAAHFLDSLENLTQIKETPPRLHYRKMPNKAGFYLLSGWPEKALRTVGEGLELSSRTGIRILDGPVLFNGALSCMVVGDYRRASEFMKTLESLPHQSLLNIQYYQSLKARENLFHRNLNEALSYANANLKLCEELGFFFNLVTAQTIKALVLHEMGKPEEAEQYCNQAIDLARRIKARGDESRAYLVKALFAFDKKNESAGVRYLQKGFSLAREKGYFAHSLGRPNAFSKLCTKALEAGIEPDYVREFIRRRKIVPEKPPRHLESWPWPVKIYTLGRFELQRDGEPVRFSGKVQPKPLLMLKALISLGGKNVREESMADLMWPEADGDVAHHSFEVTLHRLRRLIGLPEAILFQNGQVTLNENHCWVDVWAFEKILADAESVRKGGAAESAASLLQKAIDMYKGEFLSGEVEEPWMISLRERLRNGFLRSVKWSGQNWEKAGNWEKAIDCYQRGLAVDDLAEQLYSCLMICYEKTGQIAEALRTYQSCKKSLTEGLGIELSFEIQKIYQTLLKEAHKT